MSYWVVCLRLDEWGGVIVDAALPASEVQVSLELRLRLNPDIRIFVFHPPDRATRDLIFEAFAHLSEAERLQAYRHRGIITRSRAA